MRVVDCLSWLVLLSALGCAGAGPFSPLLPLEQSLIYQTSTTYGRVPAGDEAIDVWFTSDDGRRLHGRYFDHPFSHAVILFCHGNGGSVESWSSLAQELRDKHRCTVLVFDYRGYGKSEGSPAEWGLRCDARAARRWLAEHTGLPESQIVLMGRSLGGAVAVDLAANGGTRGLILESTFSSLPDVAAEHFPWLLPHWMMTQRFDSAEKIKRYGGPLLQCHGDVDRVVPIALARKLFEAAPGPKEFVVLPGAGHNDPPNQAYHQILDRFLSGLPEQ